MQRQSIDTMKPHHPAMHCIDTLCQANSSIHFVPAMSDLNRIDLNLLRVFDLLMIEGSVSRVAQKLHLSQSTISHALSRLRRQFNDDLFVPVYGGMAPTEQAKLISPLVRQAMLLLEQSINSKPVFEPARSKARFRLAGGDYVELVLLPVLMERIARLAPEITIEIEGLKATDYARELDSGTIDLVIGFETLGRLAKSLKTASIMTEQLVVIAPEPIDSSRPKTHQAIIIRLYVRFDIS
ncbi:LysR family transcriptional regulator [Endozoicomonas sp. SCSIO W0465]|uniref:LysR family transcriptional regulator n=1 Tax=Endozoicomonas sp. SCSIO W0465 TaxID=2918516 RepID=UPI002074C213|nr:LysR family transcriptional regulator [Endozoicomonas sp. SCSIO W0465]USE38245.1 LysR family transcriptional regulator [Endozoicomonas sp. SCSIO W0465]